MGLDMPDNKDYDYEVVDWLGNYQFEGTEEQCEGVMRYLNLQAGYKDNYSVIRKEIKTH